MTFPSNNPPFVTQLHWLTHSMHHSSLNNHRRACLQLQSAWSRPQHPFPKANVIRLQPPQQLKVKLQTANTPLSLMLYQHQPMLRPSRNARRRPPPPLQLPSLPATMHGVVSPSQWSRRSGWSTRYLHRRQTTEPILIAINLKASQHQPRPWWPHPTRQQWFHLR